MRRLVPLLIATALVGCGRGHKSERRVGQGRHVPVMDEEAKIVEVGLGFEFSCARTSHGKVKCWGSNNSGQLNGKSIPVNSELPVEVLGVPPAKQLEVTRTHSCARIDEGKLVCWGSHEFGELGSGATAKFEGLVRPSMTGDELAAHVNATCVWRWGNAPTCWGHNKGGRLGLPILPSTSKGPPKSVQLSPRAIERVPPPRQLAIGSQHGCALMPEGTVWCWGANDFGQLGNQQAPAPDDLPFAPEPVVGLRGVQQISAHGAVNCALKTDGTVWCWGRGADGALGVKGVAALPTTGVYTQYPFSSKALQVDGLRDVVQVHVGGAHVCAATSKGEAWCWGLNRRGQLGDGSGDDSDVPVRVKDLEDVVSIKAGLGSKRAHTCALTRAGVVWCWGHNSSGQLGIGNTDDQHEPVKVTF